MDMSRFTQGPFVIRAVIALILLAAILGLVLIPWEGQGDLSKYQAMYARGEYAVCGSELARVVERNPDWHEARELLLQVQLATGQEGPVENLMYLLEAEYATPLESLVLNRLAASDPDTLAEGRLRLEEMLKANPDLIKTRAFLIRLETATNNPANALTHLIQLAGRNQSSSDLEMNLAAICEDTRYYYDVLDQVLAADPDFNWARRMKIVIAMTNGDYDYCIAQVKQILDMGGTPPEDLTSFLEWMLLNEKDFIGALDFAMLMGREDWVQELLNRAETTTYPGIAQQIPELMAMLPDEPRLQALRVFNTHPPKEALRLLLELEESGYVPMDRLYYAENKLLLLKEARIFGPKYLKFLDDFPEEILDLAIQFRESSPEGLAAVIKELERDYPDSQEALNQLRAIASYSGDAPELVWSSSIKWAEDLALSPNGKWLAITVASKSVFVNLDTGSDWYFTPQAGDWAWSPDSQHVVGRIANVEDYQLLYVSVVRDIVQSHDTLLPEKTWPEPRVLGWLDDACLAITSQGDGGKSRVAEYNTESGEYRWLGEAREGWPILTSARSLAWVMIEAQKIAIETEDGEEQYPIEISSTAIESPLEWLPGDRKLMFSSRVAQPSSGLEPGFAYILDRDSGNFQRYDLPMAYCPGNWADTENLWGVVSFAALGLDYNAVVRENLIANTRQYAGATFFGDPQTLLSSQGKLLAVSSADGIRVYKMP